MYIFKAAVIGAGTMGSEIAQVISLSGLPVVLKDVSESQLERGMQHIREIYGRRVARGRISEREAEDRLQLITPTIAWGPLSDVDLVIEAVPENLELKQAVLREVEAHVPKTALLATNTSAILVSEIARAVSKPERLLGMHFFFPASVMRLVEVVEGKAVDEEYVAAAMEFVEGIRRIPVRMRECPGFLVNRILMAGLSEVFRCERDLALSPKEIDQAVVDAKLAPMGPYALADALGIDIAYEVAGTLTAAYGERFSLDGRLDALMAEHKLGAKTGEGFYTYTI